MFGLFGYPVMTNMNQRRWYGTASYLILGGGGGGGGVIDGGGGAGGYRTSWGTSADGSGGNSGGLSSLETALILSKGTAYTITVGQGGEGGLGYNSTTNHRGHKGRDTSISGSDITTVTSVGGGGGSALNATSTEIDGGSGGGGSNTTGGGSATLNQGFDGGTSATNGNVSGGGGGAGAVGATGTTTTSGDGGDGLASTITGTSITRAGGGGGGIRASTGSTHGNGGAGGGGDGGVQGSNSYPALAYGTVTTTSATHGRAQYGGGGGGGGYNTTGSSANTGGNGGSGIAIFRLPEEARYSAAQLAHDVYHATNCTASYLNTQVYTDDPNFDDVILLMDGTSINEDLSLQNQTITEQNTSTALSSETDPFGNTQNVLDFSRTDATGSGLKITDDPTEFGNNPFTVEMFIKLDTTGVVHTLYSDRDASGTIIMFRVNASNVLQFFKDNAGGGIFSGSTALTTGTWYHVALTYDGSTLRMFLDGALDASSSQTLTFTSSRSPYLGYDPQFPETTYQLDGRMAQVRITKGVARYTSAFTAPTSAFPNGETSTGGDHVITFAVETEDPYDGVTANDGTITWNPFHENTVVSTATTYDHGGYRYYEFTSSGSLTVFDTSVNNVDILLVGAGGGGGGGGGGGAGGEVIVASDVELSSTGTLTVTVGDGGTGGQRATSVATDGGTSSVSGILGTTITAKGGGAAGTNSIAISGLANAEGQGGSAVGNGGGEGYQSSTTPTAGVSTSISAGTHGTSSTYTIYSGYAGGTQNGVSGSGGGGAGANGSDHSGSATAPTGDGGDGVQVTGWGPTDYYYGGAGGGFGYTTSVGGNGGAGGGGGGAVNSGTVGTGDTQGRNNGADGLLGGNVNGGDGGANTGGGGGGGSWSAGVGGDGGSGMVVIRYAI